MWCQDGKPADGAWLGHLLADHAARADGSDAAGGAEAKRAFAAMMGMKKIDVAAITAARRG